ncbi:MAG: aspartate dehydrogenase [Candidatus Omnitrophota bacterium]
MKKLKIGIVGCGAIGSFLGRRITNGFAKKAILVAISDIDYNKAKILRASLKRKPRVLDLSRLIKKSDLVIEAASSLVSGKICRKVIKAGKDIMVMSVGGLLGEDSILKLARKRNCNIHIPSGAISGIDAVKAAKMGKIKKVILTTRKPPQALKGAPFMIKNRINLDNIRKETIIFEGSAKEATRAFPQNINVAATLSLAGIGAKDTQVRIISSPAYSRNIHEVEVIGDFGRIICRTENTPSEENPKTSYLAMLSALALLKQILDPVKIGN